MEPEIWMVVPQVRDRSDPTVCREVRRECERRRWDHRLVRPELHRNSAGKLIALLEPSLANNLYQRVHRARLGVLTTVDVSVQLNPTRHLLDPRWLAHLSRLVRYKAFYRRVREDRLPPDLLLAFDEWATSRHCDDERDPRVLPLHTFCPSTDCDGLHLVQGRANFETRFGPPLRRTCEQELEWTPDRQRHGGREPQNVAGLALTTGFHWDLVSERESARLLTLVDVWEVPRRRHVNVYPNGYVRPADGTRRLDTSRT